VKGCETIPSAERSVATQVHLCPAAAASWGDPRLLPKACEFSSIPTGRAYKACGQAAATLRAMALLPVYQVRQLMDMHEGSPDRALIGEPSHRRGRSPANRRGHPLAAAPTGPPQQPPARPQHGAGRSRDAKPAPGAAKPDGKRQRKHSPEEADPAVAFLCPSTPLRFYVLTMQSLDLSQLLSVTETSRREGCFQAEVGPLHVFAFILVRKFPKMHVPTWVVSSS
jgi:hypothetical protein